jgi:hypothetical protein
VDDTVQQSKDLFSLILEAIIRYAITLQSLLQKESETYGDITQGGALCLRHVEAVAFFNSSILQGLVAGMVQQSAMNGVAVARWALGDLVDPGASYVVPLWWKFVLNGVAALPHARGNDGMVVDGDTADNLAWAARTNVLNYVMTRVGTLLAVNTNNEKKLSPMQVDLLEGTKIIVSNVFSMKTPPPPEGLASSLAHQCTGFGGSQAVELLKKSLVQYSK